MEKQLWDGNFSGEILLLVLTFASPFVTSGLKTILNPEILKVRQNPIARYEIRQWNSLPNKIRWLVIKELLSVTNVRAGAASHDREAIFACHFFDVFNGLRFLDISKCIFPHTNTLLSFNKR